MANINETYCIISNATWEEHLTHLYPNPTDLSTGYKFCTIDTKNEQTPKQLITDLGFIWKEYTTELVINEMESSIEGMFVLRGNEIHKIIDHFNPQVEI